MSQITPTQPVQTPSGQKVEYDLSDMQPWREYAVILYNDEEHSQDEVVLQLIRALGCSVNRARELMFMVERNGQGAVAHAGRERAFQIAAILRQIDLKVRLRQIN